MWERAKEAQQIREQQQYERMEQVREHIARLPPEQQQPIWDRYVNGSSGPRAIRN